MRSFLLVAIVLSASVLADYPPSNHACLQMANDPTWGPYCTTCYGYDTIYEFPVCSKNNSVPNCQLSSIPDGEMRSYCQLCEVNYSLNYNNYKCDPVDQSKLVANCDLYQTLPKASSPVCMACAQGYVPNMVDPATQTISCVQDPTKYQANCQWTQIDAEKVKHQKVYFPECLFCLPGFTMYNEIKIVSLFKEKVTSTCTPFIKNDDGCMIHDTIRNALGEKQVDTCIACDTRNNYFAIQPVGKFTPGRSVCGKSK